jgi:DHA1 family inner membrane transport protein
MTRKEILLLLTLAFVQFTNILDSMIMMPMAPNLRHTMDLNTQQFSFLVGSYGLAAFCSAIAATFFIDRFDRKKALLFLYSGFLVGTTLCALAPDYWSLLGARVFAGIFGGIVGSVILSIVGDIIPLEKRARGMGILMSGFALASVVGVPLGIFLSEAFSWHAPFYFVAAIGLVVFVAVSMIVPNVTSHLKGPQDKSPSHLYKHILADRNMVSALLFSMCMVLSHFAIIPYISDYLVNNIGFSMRKDLIYMYIIGGIASSVCAPLVGKLADKHGRYKLYFILSLIACVPILLISNFSTNSFWAMIGTAVLFFVFSGGRMVPAQAMITSTVTPHIRGGFMSLNSALQQLGVFLCTMIGGTIITNDVEKKLHNYQYVGFIGIGFTILALILGRNIKPVAQHQPKKEN